MRFYPNRPDVHTEVQWFYCQPGAPVLTVPTVFNSANWFDHSTEEWPALGEVETAPRVWVDGEGPPIPLSGMGCGPITQFETGGHYPPAPNPDSPAWGLRPCCVRPFPAGCPLLANVDRHDPMLLYALSLAAWGAFEDDAALLDDIGLALAGIPAVSARVHRSSLTLPSWVAWWNGSQAIVAVSGSNNAGQFFLQVLESALGIVPGGGFRAGSYYVDAADAIRIEIFGAGMPLDVPIIFTGHSLGGSVASLLAARERQLRPDRIVSAVTFGEPRLGDRDLQNILRQHHTRIEADADIVPHIPPNFGVFQWILPLVGGSVAARWSQFKRSSAGRRVLIDGSLIASYDDSYVAGNLVALISAYLASTGLPITAEHAPSTYAQRLRKLALEQSSQIPADCLSMPALTLIDERLTQLEPPPIFEVVPDSGLFTGGAAAVELRPANLVFPFGGVFIAGAAAVSTVGVVTPAGGLFLGGAAAVSTVGVVAPAGGLFLGGAAAVSTVGVVTPAGGLFMSGAAPVSTVFNVSSTGGLAIAGTADTPIPPFDVSPSGGVFIGGACVLEFRLIYDSFTDSDATDLSDHTADTGQAWTVDGDFTVDTNDCLQGADADSALMDSGLADGVLECHMAEANGSGLIFRLSDTDHFWSAITSNTFSPGSIHLIVTKWNSGVGTDVSITELSSGLTDHVLRVDYSGDHIRASVGAVFGEFDDSTYNSNTGIGLFPSASAAGQRWSWFAFSVPI